jgi:hypothetical protein
MTAPAAYEIDDPRHQPEDGCAQYSPGMVNLSPGLCDRRLVCGIRLMNTPALTDRYKPTLSL